MTAHTMASTWRSLTWGCMLDVMRRSHNARRGRRIHRVHQRHRHHPQITATGDARVFSKIHPLRGPWGIHGRTGVFGMLRKAKSTMPTAFQRQSRPMRRITKRHDGRVTFAPVQKATAGAPMMAEINPPPYIGNRFGPRNRVRGRVPWRRSRKKALGAHVDAIR